MYTKGAESELASLLSDGKLNETYRHIDEYARQGLRTLVVAMREIPRDEYEAIHAKLEQANNMLENRRETVKCYRFLSLHSPPSSYFILQVRRTQAAVERRLKLLGATAVEDRLQEGKANNCATSANTQQSLSNHFAITQQSLCKPFSTTFQPLFNHFRSLCVARRRAGNNRRPEARRHQNMGADGRQARDGHQCRVLV